MKKILVVFLVIALIFICCDTDRGYTARSRCANDVFSNESAMPPEFCAIFLGGLSSSSGSSETTDAQKKTNELFSDLFLIQCLNYNLEMYKCEKKSNILPP